MIRDMFLSIFLLMGCTSKIYPEKLTSSSQIRKISVNTAREARMVVDNQVRFLELLFEQSRDPYYGQLKWSETCLLENQVGQQESRGQAYLSISKLYFDEKGNPGVCFGNRMIYVWLYCSDDQFVQEIRIPIHRENQLNEILWCP
jgi:hypothetical protein